MKQLTLYLLSALLSSTLLLTLLSGCDEVKPVHPSADVTVPVTITPMPVPTIHDPDPALPRET